MPIDVGTIRATLTMNIKDYEKSLNTAKDKTEDLGDEVGKDLPKSVNKGENSVSDFRDTVEKAGKSEKDTTEKSKELANQTEKTGEETKKSGEKFKTFGETVEDTKKKFDALKGTVAGLAITALVTGFIAALKEFTDELNTAADTYVDFFNTLETTTGNVAATAEIKSLISEAQGTGKAYSSELYAEAMGTLYNYDSDLLKDKDLFIELSTLAIDYSKVMGVDVSDGIKDVMTITRKWGLEVEDVGDLMQKIYAANLSIGDYNGIIAFLEDADQACVDLGWTIDDTFARMVDANQNGAFDDLQDAMSGLSRIAKSDLETYNDIVSVLDETVSSSGDLDEAVAKLSESYPSYTRMLYAYAKYGGANDLTAAQEKLSNVDFQISDRTLTSEEMAESSESIKNVNRGENYQNLMYGNLNLSDEQMNNIWLSFLNAQGRTATNWGLMNNNVLDWGTMASNMSYVQQLMYDEGYAIDEENRTASIFSYLLSKGYGNGITNNITVNGDVYNPSEAARTIQKESQKQAQGVYT